MKKLVIVFLFISCSICSGQTVDNYIKQLNDENYIVRDRAEQELLKLYLNGEKFNQSDFNTQDEEVKQRGIRIQKAIKENSLWVGTRVSKLDKKITIGSFVEKINKETKSKIDLNQHYGPNVDSLVSVKDGPLLEIIHDVAAQCGATYDGKTISITGDDPTANVFNGLFCLKIKNITRSFKKEITSFGRTKELQSALNVNMDLLWEHNTKIVSVGVPNGIGDGLHSIAKDYWLGVVDTATAYTLTCEFHNFPLEKNKIDNLLVTIPIYIIDGYTEIELDLSKSIYEIDGYTFNIVNNNNIISISVISDEEYETNVYVKNKEIKLSLNPNSQDSVVVYNGKDDKPKTVIISFPTIKSQKNIKFNFKNIPTPSIIDG